MKDILHKNVSYKKIGLIFLGFALIIYIGANTVSHTPSTDITSNTATGTQEGFYINIEKGFSVQFPTVAKVTENTDGTTYADIESPHKAKIMITTFGNSDKISKEKWIPAENVITDITSLENKTTQLADQEEKLFGSKSIVIKSELSDLDGIPAYFIELENTQMELKTLSYSLLKDGHFYEVSILYSNNDEEYISPLFNKFTESFKVLGDK